jgi:hypothetical protein
LIVVALQTEGQAAFVQIFDLLATGADKFDAAPKLGMWTGPVGAGQFWTENRSRLLAHTPVTQYAELGPSSWASHP